MFIVSNQGEICPLPSHRGGLLEEKGNRLVVLGEGNILVSPVPCFLDKWQWILEENMKQGPGSTSLDLSPAPSSFYSTCPKLEMSSHLMSLCSAQHCIKEWGKLPGLAATCLQVGGRKQEQKQHLLSIIQLTGSWTSADLHVLTFSKACGFHGLPWTPGMVKPISSSLPLRTLVGKGGFRSTWGNVSMHDCCHILGANPCPRSLQLSPASTGSVLFRNHRVFPH